MILSVHGFICYFFEKLKIDETIRFSKGNLGDLTDHISIRANKQSRKTQKQNSFLNFC